MATRFVAAPVAIAKKARQFTTGRRRLIRQILQALGPELDLDVGDSNVNDAITRLEATLTANGDALADLVDGSFDTAGKQTRNGKVFDDLSRSDRRALIKKQLRRDARKLVAADTMVRGQDPRQATGQPTIPQLDAPLLYDPTSESPFNTGSAVAMAPSTAPKTVLSDADKAAIAVGVALAGYAPDPSEYPHMYSSAFPARED